MTRKKSPRERDEADAILRALGELAREQSGDALADARWETVTAGTATEEQRAVLAGAAARELGLDRTATALFDPLDASVLDRIHAAASAELAAPADDEPSADEDLPPRSAETRTSTTNVRELRAPSALRRSYALASGLALAACLLLVVALVHRRGVEHGRASALLPTYELAMAGGVAEERGDTPPAALALRAGMPLVLTLRPATRVEGPLVASAAIVRDGQSTPLHLDLTISPDGALRMKGVVEQLALSPGPAELSVRIARPSVDAGALVVRRPILWTVAPR